MIIVEIAGYLGADPEERFTTTGKRVVTLRVATRPRQGKREGGRDETVWWSVTIWGDRFDRMLPYLKKGSSVIIIGEMGKPETYVAKDGSTQISLNLTAELIKFSPFGKPETSLSEQQNEGSYKSQPQEQFATFGAAVDSDSSFSGDDAFTGDDLPF